MQKLTIQEAADKMGVSKEAIHNRIRRGTLESVMQSGVKYVLFQDEQKEPKPSVSDDKYYKYLEEQNQKLQNRIEFLESESRELRNQKELLLIEEKNKIEQIYRQKDEQLKSIVQAISTKLIPQKQEEPSIEAEVEIPHIENRLIGLKKHLKALKLKPKKIDKIFARFDAASDIRVLKVGKKIYIDPQKYDYSDLLGNLE